MVMEKKKLQGKRENFVGGDKVTWHRKVKELKVTKKFRSADEEEEDEPSMGAENEFVPEEAESEMADDSGPECDEASGTCTKKKHIHPCICDLTTGQLKRIEAFHRHKRIMQKKYDKRVREIEEELELMEEERLEREREEQEQEELFGDEYEVVGKKKKRKKRSARRASMVSLGVKQVINWRKPPKVQVKMTVASLLRKGYTSYCGRVFYPLSPPLTVDYHKEPTIPVRSTVTSDSRSKVNFAKRNYLIEQEDKRPPFQLSYYM